MSAPDAVCAVCDRTTPADTVVSAPADTGPFTNVAESFDFRPFDRWDMPVCKEHAAAMTATVACSTCHRELPYVDAIVNSSGTVALCRPCNAKENG